MKRIETYKRIECPNAPCAAHPHRTCRCVRAGHVHTYSTYPHRTCRRARASCAAGTCTRSRSATCCSSTDSRCSCTCQCLQHEQAALLLRVKHPSAPTIHHVLMLGGGSALWGGGSSTATQTQHDSIWPIRLTVALGLKTRAQKHRAECQFIFSSVRHVTPATSVTMWCTSWMSCPSPREKKWKFNFT